MIRPLALLTDLAREVQKTKDLEQLLQQIVDTVPELLETFRANIRLLAPSGDKLMAICRSGTPAHMDPSVEFVMGEGLIGWIAKNRVPIRTGDADHDPRFAKREGLKERLGSFLGVPLIAGETALGVISTIHPNPNYFTEEHQAYLTLLAGICAPYVEIARLARVATMDPLTGVLNRRGFDFSCPPNHFKGLDAPVSVAVMDIDHFKQINDAYGHAVGDGILTHVGQELREAVRKEDLVVRIGGEEFLLMLPGIGLDRAVEIAERTRTNLQNSNLEMGGHRIALTVSFGVATRLKGESRDDAIQRADKALYRAKEAGRNRVAVAKPD